jgi:hypothetical protein
VELFEEIRREHAHGAGTTRAVAKKLGVHRRMCDRPWLVRFRRSANWRRETSRGWVR